MYRTRCGAVADEVINHQIHYKSEMNRLTFLEASKRSKVNGFNGGQVQNLALRRFTPKKAMEIYFTVQQIKSVEKTRSFDFTS
ncbi:hypothetical protein TNIN_199651 [Trichonephila inaurata madagascariensis]|uniref:Uncharacterized protein n=1 Tax=Trichonephila inaurata madagascariensis TaxID=2747483 RepID=A0A8X7C5S7_9ARAC|nr:hypothetical protein TNIN_199651 [Trichonephila inaurata madagascariensis]